MTFTVGRKIQNQALALPLALLMTLFSTAAAFGQQVSAKGVAKAALPALVTIQTFDDEGKQVALGSGFVVRGDGLIVTNFHVIDGATTAKVTLPSSETYQVNGILEADVEKDFAILKIKAVDLPTLRMGNSSRIDTGEVVLALGAPLGLSGSVTVGTFSQLREAGQHRMLQHSAAITHGSSGGPLMLESGEVIGVNTSGAEGGGFNFALPINYVRAALDSTDGTLVSLRDLTNAVKKYREDAKAQMFERFLKENFTLYRDPDNLFSALVPRHWQIQRNSWTDADGTRHVVVMAGSSDAQFADLNGWLSEGMRLHLTLPATGRHWNSNSAASWTEQSVSRFLRSYAQSSVAANESVGLDGLAAQRLAVVGTGTKLREPEVAYLYHSFSPNAVAVVELVAPKSLAEALGVIRDVFESSLTVNWTKAISRD